MVPFPGMTVHTVPAAIMGGQRPERPPHPGLTDTLWKLTERCWEEAPGDRPEMEDVVKHLKEMLVIPFVQTQTPYLLMKLQGIYSPTQTTGRDTCDDSRSFTDNHSG